MSKIWLATQRKRRMFPKEMSVVRFLIVALASLSGGVPKTASAQEPKALALEDVVLRGRSLADLSSVEFSPDGKWLAYVVRTDERGKSADALKESRFRSGVSGNAIGTDIWVSNTKTGEARNLTNESGENWLPKWSPDGRCLAFLSDRDGSGQARLWIWDANESNLKRVSDVDVRTWQMEWAPDGHSIFVTIMPGGLSADARLKRIQSDTESQNKLGEKAQGSTVILYRSSALVRGNEDKEDPKSDPWSLNDWPRDLANVDVVTGQATLVSRGQGIETYRLSPDGSRVAFTVPKRFEKPGSQQILFDLVTVTLATNQEKVIASNIRLNHNGATFSWSPDGALLSYHTSGEEAKTQDCYIVSTAGGPARNITEFLPLQKPYGGYSSVPLWNPSGNYIYFVHDGALWQASVTQGKASEIARIRNHQIGWRLLSKLDNLLWTTNDGDSTIVVARDDLGKQDGFYRINLTTGDSIKLLENGQCYSCSTLEHPFAVTRDRQLLAYLAEDAQHGADLWLSDEAFKSPRRFTHLNPQFDKYKLGAARLVDWLSDDGEQLRGALLLPSGYQAGKRYPLVVWVYGGALQSNEFDSFGFKRNAPMNMQLLATRGYAVLLPDSPQHEGTPMADLAKTVLPGVNRVIEMGIADPERLGVMGHSNGGYSTLALIVQTKRFKAAIDIDGAGDLVGSYGEMRSDGTAFGTALFEHTQNGLGGTPWQVRERYIENSPVFYLDRVETPLLIVHGTEDRAVAQFLGDEIFVALRRLGKEVEYAKYEGEGHYPGSFANKVDFYNRMFAWLDKYLKTE
jgi:dipeptidyl aminopeptidase/acylaminoacyl peptidase